MRHNIRTGVHHQQLLAATQWEVPTVR